MITLIELFIFFGIGILAGLMSGLFGIGGGSVRIPLLNLAGMSLLGAFGTNLLVIPFSSAVGAISQRRNINRKVALYVIIGGTIGSITGAFMVGLIPVLLLAILFVIVSILTVSGIYFDRLAPNLYRAIRPNRRILITGSFFLNLITGMRGGSGGSLFPPFLRMMKLDIHRAIATSLFVTIFTAITASIIYWGRGNLELLPSISVLIGSMTGARIGSRISVRTKPLWLELGLSLLVLALSSIIICKAL